MEKKFLIPTIIGTILAAILIFTVVYKKTSNEPTKTVEIETVAPKETKPIESKVSTQQGTSSLKDFNVNTKGVREAGEGKDIPNLDIAYSDRDKEDSENGENNEDNTVLSNDSNEDLIPTDIKDELLGEGYAEELNQITESIDAEEKAKAEANLTPEHMKELLEMSGY